MSRPPDELSLIQRAKALDEEAIAELYRRHVQPIYRYILYRVGDPNTAQDLTAEVFLRMVEGLPKYRERGYPFSSWLYSIANARVIDYFRHQRRHPQVPIDTLILTDHATTPDAHVHEQETIQELHRALNDLTPEQQTVVILRFIEGYDINTVAQIMRKKPGAIKALQHRALARMQRFLTRLAKQGSKEQDQ